MTFVISQLAFISLHDFVRLELTVVIIIKLEKDIKSRDHDLMPYRAHFYILLIFNTQIQSIITKKTMNQFTKKFPNQLQRNQPLDNSNKMDSNHISCVQKKKKCSNQKSENLKWIRWTLEENLLYVRFLKQNLQKVLKINPKSQKKFFKFERMSNYIVTKTPDQCRSHHQKMRKRFLTIQNIIHEMIPKKVCLKNSQIKEELIGRENQLEMQSFAPVRKIDKPTEQPEQNDSSMKIVMFQSQESIFDVLMRFDNEDSS